MSGKCQGILNQLKGGNPVIDIAQRQTPYLPHSAPPTMTQSAR